MSITGDLLASTLAGIAFIGCALTSAAPAPGSQPQPRRRGNSRLRRRRVADERRHRCRAVVARRKRKRDRRHTVGAKSHVGSVDMAVLTAATLRAIGLQIQVRDCRGHAPP